MNSLKSVAIVALVTALAGCDGDSDDSSVVGSDRSAVEGSGVLVTRTEDVSDFDELEIASIFRASITQGDSFALSLRLDDNVVEHLRVERTGSTLRVSFGDFSGNYRNVTAEATVVMPDIVRLDVSGVSQADISGFAFQHDLDVRVSGVSALSGSVSAGDVEINVSRPHGCGDLPHH